MQLDSKEVTTECLFVPPAEEKCLSESKVNGTADYGVNGINQLSFHTNNLDCNEPSHNSACTPEEFDFLNEKCILTTPPNADIYDNQRFCLKADKGKDSFKIKSVRICPLLIILFSHQFCVRHLITDLC